MVGQLEISEPNKQIPTLNGWLFMGSFTTWKINMEHNNEGLEDDFPFQLDDFYVPC